MLFSTPIFRRRKTVELKIQEGESRLHFIWRVYKYREDTGSITTEEAGTICRKELDETYDESTYRKVYFAFKDMWNSVKEEYILSSSNLERLDEIEEREDELYKQQVKTRDWLREKRNYLRSEARIENIKESLVDAYNSAPFPVFVKPDEKRKDGLSAILMLSDWHVGIVIENFWNTFNKEVFEKRLEELLFEVVRYCEIHNVSTLYVANLGDMISGAIHATTRLAEEMDVLDQAMYVAKSMAMFLGNLSEFGFDVKYSSVVGNHDRINKAYKEHIEKESFNKMVDWYICDKVEDGSLDIEFLSNVIDDGISTFEVDGEPYFAVHGHLDSVNTVFTNLTQGIKIIPTGILMGHFHSKATQNQNNHKIYVNGSLSGVDTYAKDKRYFTDPSQTLIIIDGKNIVDIDINLK